MALYKQQQKALDAINVFIDSKELSVFILRGYAGTGKTTMIKSILPELSRRDLCGILMAPTGSQSRYATIKGRSQTMEA